MKEYGPFPKPEWVEAMKEINSKSLKEWEEIVKKEEAEKAKQPKTPKAQPQPSR